MFLASFDDDPEDQRFGKAVVHLRSLVFSRLSEDHVVAFALLHELSELYRQAFGTDQVTRDPSRRSTQEEALEAHLYALGLPAKLSELEPHEVVAIVRIWEHGYADLPKPFDKTLGAFVLHAKTQLAAAQTPEVPSYQLQ